MKQDISRLFDCPLFNTHETAMSTSRTPPSSIKINNVAKRSRTADGDIDASGDSVTLDAAVRMLMDQFTETKTLIDKMRSEINTRIDTVKTELEGKLEVVSNDIQSLRTECAGNFQNYDATLNGLDGRVDAISSTLDNLENRNELIISGIPYLNGEDLQGHFMAMWKRLGIDERTRPVVDIRRLKSGPINDGDHS